MPVNTKSLSTKFGLKLTDFCPKCSHQVMDHEVDAVTAARHNGRGNTKATDIAVYNQLIGFGTREISVADSSGSSLLTGKLLEREATKNKLFEGVKVNL